MRKMAKNTASERSGNRGTVVPLVSRPFWNPAEGRVRAFWRILGAIVVTVVLVSAIGFVVRSRFSIPTTMVVRGVLAAVFALGLLAVWARYVDKRRFPKYGFRVDRDWWIDLGAGVVIGVLIHFGAFATFLLMGWARVTELGYAGAAGGSFAVAFVAMAVGYACVAIWEELVFRGLFITDGAEGLGRVSPRAAVTIASLLAATVFGLLHFQQAPSAVSLLFWIGMGCVLAFAYALTGELAVPIGLHFAYNFAGNTIFGITGVVTDEQPTLVRLAFTGPEAFVQLAGVVNSLFVGVAFVLVLAWIRWHYGELRLQTSLAAWRSE